MLSKIFSTNTLKSHCFLNLLLVLLPTLLFAHGGHTGHAFEYGKLRTEITSNSSQLEMRMVIPQHIGVELAENETPESLMTTYLRQYFEIKTNDLECPLTLNGYEARESETILSGLFTCSEPITDINSLFIRNVAFSDFFENFENEVHLTVLGVENVIIFSPSNPEYSYFAPSTTEVTSVNESDVSTLQASEAGTSTQERKQRNSLTLVLTVLLVLIFTYAVVSGGYSHYRNQLPDTN